MLLRRRSVSSGKPKRALRRRRGALNGNSTGSVCSHFRLFLPQAQNPHTHTTSTDLLPEIPKFNNSPLNCYQKQFKSIHKTPGHPRRTCSPCLFFQPVYCLLQQSLSQDSAASQSTDATNEPDCRTSAFVLESNRALNA